MYSKEVFKFDVRDCLRRDNAYFKNYFRIYSDIFIYYIILDSWSKTFRFLQSLYFHLFMSYKNNTDIRNILEKIVD